MNKNVVGSFSSTFEALRAINSLKEKGVDKNHILIITQDNYDQKFIEEKSGVTADDSFRLEENKKGFWRSLFSKKEVNASPYSNFLVKLGVAEEDAKTYANDVENGKILVLVEGGSDEERPVI